MTKVKATKSIVGVLLIIALLLFSGAAFAGEGNTKGSLSDTVTSLQVDSATTEVVQPDQSEQQTPEVVQPQQDQAIDQEEAVVPEPKKLPIAKVEPENGATLVRPDAPIRIVFDTNSPFFTHVDKQLKKGHFFVTVNGEKIAAEYDGKSVVTANPGLLKRYTRYDVKFILHPEDNGQHNGFGNGNGQPWENKSYEFSFETGSDLNEPRHVKLEALSSAPKVTDNGGVMELSFTDDYGQPGYGAKGIVRLTEYGTRKPDSAKADPAEFTVQQGSDGKQVVRITDTEAEKVSVEAAISGPYAEDAATVTAEFTFRPGPAAKISLSPDKEKVVVGQSLNVSGTAVDMYDNPVEDGTAVSVTASAGEAANTSTKDGAFSFAYTAPTKKQPVNLTVKVDQCEAKLDIPVVADAPAKITVTPEKQKAIAGSPVKVSVLVEDQYGNPVEDGTKVMLVASGGTVSPSEAVTKDGVVEVQATSGQTGEVAVKASTENGVSGSVAISFVSVVPAGSRVKLDALPGNIPGEYTVKGQVTKDGTPVPSVAVPLIVKNGELSDPMPVTNQQGEFSVTLKKGDSSGCVTVAVDGSQAPGVTSGTVGIDPLVYGNQTWTDTGIDVGAGLLIRVNATGTWASELYAKVGDSGTPVKVGTNGGFVTGATGRLYLGPSTAGYADDVDAIIYVDDPAAVGILPTISLTANPTQIPADGKSTSALTGKVMYGQYPGVGVAVNLSAALGTVNPASPETNADGAYQATFTAGTQGGTATVTATYKNLTQQLNVTLAPSTPGTGAAIMLSNPEVIADVSLDKGLTVHFDAAENGVVAFTYIKTEKASSTTFNLTPTVKVYDPATNTTIMLASKTYYNVNSCISYNVATNGRYVAYNDITSGNYYIILYDIKNKTSTKIGTGRPLSDTFQLNDNYLVFTDSWCTNAYDLTSKQIKPFNFRGLEFSIQPHGTILAVKPVNDYGIYQVDLKTGIGWNRIINAFNARQPHFLNDEKLHYIDITTYPYKQYLYDMTTKQISDCPGSGILSASGEFALTSDLTSLYNFKSGITYPLTIQGMYSKYYSELTPYGLYTLNGNGPKILKYSLDMSSLN